MNYIYQATEHQPELSTDGGTFLLVCPHCECDRILITEERWTYCANCREALDLSTDEKELH